MNKNTRIKLRNRSKGTVSYTLPDMNNLRRFFQPGEAKEVSFEEIQRLTYQPGGERLLADYLVIENEEAVNELLGKVELEYNYTSTDIKKLLTTGSMDELLDCLDFAPIGVIELVKDLAVSLEIGDINKRKAILDATGFDVTKAIDFKHENEKPDNAPAATAATRRVTQSTESDAEAPARRVVVKK